jgi:hypothetical protein
MTQSTSSSDTTCNVIFSSALTASSKCFAEVRHGETQHRETKTCVS